MNTTYITNLFSNETWRKLFKHIRMKSKGLEYREVIAASYAFNPVTDHIMTASSNIFDLKKAAAMYFWYKLGDRADTMILNYFDEYNRCVDKDHKEFNSNYGYYAYVEGGLDRCIRYLAESKNTRQACFCINNNKAMSPESIDKLCTNTIQFFIRKNKLEMVVQMRSSNFLTLLPYDAFMFTVFYQHVYSELRNNVYYDLQTGLIHMQVASLHMYDEDLNKYIKTNNNEPIIIADFADKNWQIELEQKLLKALKNNANSES